MSKFSMKLELHKNTQLLKLSITHNKNYVICLYVPSTTNVLEFPVPFACLSVIFAQVERLMKSAMDPQFIP